MKIISHEYNLVMRFTKISSLLFQIKRKDALIELKKFIKYYKALSKDYEKSWLFNGVKNFITTDSQLPEKDKNLLFELIDILESPKPEADKKIKEFESKYLK